MPPPPLPDYRATEDASQNSPGSHPSQSGTALIPQDIIHMDYLVDNVIGRIPAIDELTDVAQTLVSLQGVRAAQKRESEADS